MIFPEKQHQVVIVATSQTGRIAENQIGLYPFLYLVPALLTIAGLRWTFQWVNGSALE